MDDEIKKFWGKVKKVPGCWEWIAGKVGDGYGQLTFNKNIVMAHRLSWELTNGKIKKGLVIDHLCGNKSCVNPKHLEPVTNKVNLLRSNSPWAINARKTHCNSGHEFTKENTSKDRMGSRQCVTCRRKK